MMMNNENKFINENDFYDNLRIIYIEETKKLHIALLDTRGANFNSNNQSATLNEKFLDSIQNTYSQDSKNIKNKPIPRAIPNAQVSSLAILFDLIEEILFNEKNKDLQLNFKNTPGFGITFGIKRVADQFADKSGLENVKDINRFGRIYAFMIKWGLILKSEVGKDKTNFGTFESKEMHELFKKHFGDNYLKLIYELNFSSLVKNISSIKNSPQQDFLYEIQFQEQSLNNFEEFLTKNESVKKFSNGMKILDSKLFMQKFFPNFIKENLICEEIAVEKELPEIVANSGSQSTIPVINDDSISSDDNDEELFEDAVESLNKSNEQNVQEIPTLPIIPITPRDLAIPTNPDENPSTTTTTTNSNDQTNEKIDPNTDQNTSDKTPIIQESTSNQNQKNIAVYLI